MHAKRNDLPLPGVPMIEKNLILLSRTSRGISRWQLGQASFLQTTPLGSIAKPSGLNREGRKRIKASSLRSRLSPAKL